MARRIDFFASDILNDDDWEPALRRAIEENSVEYKQEEEQRKQVKKIRKIADEQESELQQQNQYQYASIPQIVMRFSGQDWTNILLLIIIVLLVLILIFK